MIVTTLYRLGSVENLIIDCHDLETDLANTYMFDKSEVSLEEVQTKAQDLKLRLLARKGE